MVWESYPRVGALSRLDPGLLASQLELPELGEERVLWCRKHAVNSVALLGWLRSWYRVVKILTCLHEGNIA